jgi:hypothetical protein
VDDQTANGLAVAQIGAEHTEAMRRARLDGIWPYMYAGWTRTRLAARMRETGKGSAVWKANFAAPESAAWHSSLSPVLASLDLFDADYLTGQPVTTDLHLINDSWHDAKIRVDVLLTTANPEWIPEAECLEKPIRKWSFDFTLKADSVEKAPVTWNLPESEGCYSLTARTTGIVPRPVCSANDLSGPLSRPTLRTCSGSARSCCSAPPTGLDRFSSHGVCASPKRLVTWCQVLTSWSSGTRPTSQRTKRRKRRHFPALPDAVEGCSSCLPHHGIGRSYAM